MPRERVLAIDPRPPRRARRRRRLVHLFLNAYAVALAGRDPTAEQATSARPSRSTPRDACNADRDLELIAQPRRDAVRTAFVDVLAEHGGLPFERAEAWMTDLESAGRYRPDLWA